MFCVYKFNETLASSKQHCSYVRKKIRFVCYWWDISYSTHWGSLFTKRKLVYFVFYFVIQNWIQTEIQTLSTSRTKVVDFCIWLEFNFVSYRKKATLWSCLRDHLNKSKKFPLSLLQLRNKNKTFQNKYNGFFYLWFKFQMIISVKHRSHAQNVNFQIKHN